MSKDDVLYIRPILVDLSKNILEVYVKNVSEDTNDVAGDKLFASVETALAKIIVYYNTKEAKQ